MKKRIVFNEEARENVLKGLNIAADAVRVTLGAEGRNVLISRASMGPEMTYHFPIHVTKDGVTVTKSIQLPNELENVGAMLAKQASEKTAEQAGDGTTTTVVILHALVNLGLKLLAEKRSPVILKQKLEQAAEHILDKLKEMAIPIQGDKEKIRQIATVSANGDSFIGDLVADAYSEIGEDGMIDIQEAKGTKTSIKISDGFKFGKGWISHNFVNNVAKWECELEKPYILLYDRAITTMKSFIEIIKKVAAEQRSLLIVCDDMDGEALAFLATNAAQGNLKACAVKAPYFQDLKSEFMEDLAACTSATFISDTKGIGIENVQLSHLGTADKVVVTKESTVIIGGVRHEERYLDILNNLKMTLTQKEDEDEKRMIEGRIARLMGGVAVISVGGLTEVEMKERKDRVDDAVRATKAATSEGYVAGGGCVFVHLLKEMGEADEGMGVLGAALHAPIKQICENADENYAEIISTVALSSSGYGYNVRTRKVEDLVSAGIIDPVKVLRCSIQNAVSVANMILTTQVMICDVNE